MANRQWHFLSLCTALVLLLFSLGGEAAPLGQVTDYVFRGDDRDPTAIKKTGGFKPTENTYNDQLAFSLHAHIDHTQGDTAYVSTSKSFGVAVQFATTEGWVYRVHRLGNMIDTNAALRDPPAAEQQEFAALGGVPYDAIEGWWQVPKTLDVPEFSEDQAKELDRDYAAKYQNNFIQNPDFNFEKYKNEQVQGPGEDVDVLASMPEEDPNKWDDTYWEGLRNTDFKTSALSFMNKHASSLGWKANQQFPLALWEEGSGEPPAKKPKVEETAGPSGQTVPASTAPKYVFYGDYLWPAEAKRQGGFLTPADSLATIRNPPVTAYTLNTHLNRDKLKLHPETYFVAAHQTFGAAAKEAVKKAAKFGGQFDPVVYLVHATPHMFKVGNELAVPGGMVWGQVRGWTQVPRDYALPEKTPKTKQELHEHFEKAYKAKPKVVFQKNPDYDSKFDQYTATEKEQPQLVGSRKASRELTNFMKEHGSAVGFQDKFPLFTAPKVITGEASAAAKNVEPAPHEEEGVLEQVWDFVKAHAVAIALLPAVAALNLIPGVGEVADAFEFAALSTEAAEGTGLVLEGTTALEEGAVIGEEGTVAVEEGTTTVEEDVATVEQPDKELELPDVPTDPIEEDLNLPDVPTHPIEEDLNLPDVPTDPIEVPEAVPADKVALKAD
ncbi:Heat-labile enterotoxin A chain [Metarhizium anisopliae]